MLDLKIEKSMTINTGNFSSIKPSISITKSVSSDNLEKEYEKLSELGDALLAREILSLSEEILDVNERGIEKYCELLQENVEEINKTIRDFR